MAYDSYHYDVTCTICHKRRKVRVYLTDEDKAAKRTKVEMAVLGDVEPSSYVCTDCRDMDAVSI